MSEEKRKAEEEINSSGVTPKTICVWNSPLSCWIGLQRKVMAANEVSQAYFFYVFFFFASVDGGVGERATGHTPKQIQAGCFKRMGTVPWGERGSNDRALRLGAVTDGAAGLQVLRKGTLLSIGINGPGGGCW